MKRLIYPCLVLLIACSQPQQKGLVYYNDLESIKGWADVNNLSNEYAHSGIFSNKLDSIHQFGIAFKQDLKDISHEKISKITVSMWVYITPQAKGNIVVEIRNHDGQQLSWDAQHFDASNVEPNKWQLVSKDFMINSNIDKPENKAIVYPWNNGKNDFYIDDIRIEFIP